VTGIRFNGVRSINWFGTDAQKIEDLEDITSVLEKTLESSGIEKSYIYFGGGFGRYDLIVEFCHEREKVASYIASNLAKAVREESPETRASTTCLSTLLCNDVVMEGRGQEVALDHPIRTYAFLQVDFGLGNRANEFLEELLKDFGSNCLLTWNSSTYPFLLIGWGRKYTDLMPEMVRCRDRQTETGSFISRSCTFTTLRLGATDEPNDKNIEAVTDVRMKPFVPPFTPLLLPEAKDERGPVGKECLGRHGGFDKSVWVSSPNLRGITDFILELRAMNKTTIENTATVLMWRD
jgi:hypothetical protein